MSLPAELVALARTPARCYLATVMPDGSPQLTQIWIDTDGTDLVFNTVRGHQKQRNIDRDPRVALNIADPMRPSRYWFVRGVVTEVTQEGAREHIEELAIRYTGEPYQWYGGRDQVRLRMRVSADSVHPMG